MFTPSLHRTMGFSNGFVSPKSGYSRVYTRQRGPCLITPHFFMYGRLPWKLFFYIEPQKRSRVTKLGAQTKQSEVRWFVPPSASKQSEITCGRDKCMVFHNIGQAISGSTSKYLANEKGGGTDLTWRWPISSLYSTSRRTLRPF